MRMNPRAINLHIVRNSVTHDSRVLKETATLMASGKFAEVAIAGFQEAGLAEYETIDGRHLWRVALASRRLPKDLFSQTLKYAEWHWHLIGKYRDTPLSVIHCHDLEPLPIAIRLKHLTGARLVYDAHELETERSSLRGIRQVLARLTERRCMNWVDAVITVSPSIRDWYRLAYPDVPVSMVRNVPERPHSALIPVDLRKRLNVPEEALVFIYLGGLGHGRGIENMLAAFSAPQITHHLVIVGNGTLLDKVVAASAACPRIHYLPAVPPDQVLAHAAGADIGISLIEDVSLSYRYCLPNKLFESVLAGLPVLVSDLPDQAAFVTSYRAGWVTESDLPSIIAHLASIDRDQWSEVQNGLAERSRDVGWHNEAVALLSLYDTLLRSAGLRVEGAD